MVRILALVLVSGLLFAAGLAGSYFTLGKPEPLEAEASHFGQRVPVRAVEEHVPTETVQVTQELATVLSEKPLSPEEVFRYSALFRDQQQALDRQRELMEQRQHRLQLMEEDMRRARLELDGLRAETASVLQQGEALLQRVQQEQSQAEEARQKAAAEQVPSNEGGSVSSDSEQANLKQISRWFAGMPAEKAAEYLQELSNNGKLNSAVQLLGNIEERDAAKILSSMQDPGLVVQLTEEFKVLKRPVKKKR
jgi:flagellar motility protein MotE (MotC chaperone)